MSEITTTTKTASSAATTDKKKTVAATAVDNSKKKTAPVVPLPTESSNNSSNKRPMPTTPGSKKRPYRRTKRPKNYCDKSTVTTTTPTAQMPVNVYDAVLGECEDLLQASLEAQRLGRLKMASAYQLLLHTRLVGLGKRFDRTTIAVPPRRRRGDDDDEQDDDDDDEEEHDEEYEDESGEEGAEIAAGQAPPSAAAAGEPNAAAGAANDDLTPKNLPPALQQLTSILPSNLEMDTSMMEHLARAAVELHHQRTGRKKSADGLLASPMTGMIGSPDTKVAWTPNEHEIVQKAMKEKKAPYAIAKLLPSKTEAQVKAYIKNQQKSAQTSALVEEMASPGKKRGGRGRKPPTTAMNTVPNANLDAKSLLKGFLRKK